MKTWKFKNGDQIPMIGLGTWKSESQQVYNAVREAIKIGYRHIDCAHIYMNEGEIGDALSDAIKAGEVKREELWITSKLWNNAHVTEDVMPALQETLSNLKLDYLDLYLIHWPVAHKKEVVFPQAGSDFVRLEEVPIANTWAGMEAVRDAGLTRHIGVSNFSVTKLIDLQKHCKTGPEVNQIELQPLLQQKEMLAFCAENQILLTAYSPLGSRDRNAQMKGENEPDLFENEIISSIASKHSCSPAQTIISWSVERGTAVIPKSVNPERLKQNLAAADIQLDDEDRKLMESLDKHYRYITGGFWAMPDSPYTIENLWDE